MGSLSMSKRNRRKSRQIASRVPTGTLKVVPDAQPVASVGPILDRATSSESVYADGRTPYFGRVLPDTYVTGDTALSYGPVFACIRLISDPICAMPRRHYVKLPNGGQEELDSDIAWLLNIQPNDEMTSFDWLKSMLLQRLLWGSAYSEIERDLAGRPIAIWPLSTERMYPKREGGYGKLYYEYWNEGRDPVRLDPFNVLHFKGVSYDGITSYSPIQLAAKSVALGMAEERFGLSYFSNGAVPGGIIENASGKKLSQEAVEHLLGTFNETHQGPARAHRVHYLDNGMTYKPIAVPADSAQFLESRNFQIEEITRWFGVPPHKLGLVDRQNTAGNVEQQNMQFVGDTLMPIIVSMEAEYGAKLLGRNTRSKQFIRHDTTELLRGDIASRYEAYGKGIRAGFLLRNEVRRKEGFSPLEGLDVPLTEQNMVPAGLQAKKLEADIELVEMQADKLEAELGGEGEAEMESEGESEVESEVESEGEGEEVGALATMDNRLQGLAMAVDYLGKLVQTLMLDRGAAFSTACGTPGPAVNVTVQPPAQTITVENSIPPSELNFRLESHAHTHTPPAVVQNQYDFKVDNRVDLPSPTVEVSNQYDFRVANQVDLPVPIVEVKNQFDVRQEAPNVTIEGAKIDVAAPVVQNSYEFTLPEVQVETPAVEVRNLGDVYNSFEMPPVQVEVQNMLPETQTQIINRNEILMPEIEIPAPVVNVTAESNPTPIVNEICVPEAPKPEVVVQNVINVAPSPAPDVIIQVDPTTT